MKSIMKLKLLVILLTTMLFSVLVNAQNDTTQLKIGDKKVLIIQEGEELQDGISELKRGIKDFDNKITNYEKKITQLRDTNKVLEAELKITSDENRKNEIEKEIQKNENEIIESQKKIDAFNNGIKEIESEIEELSDKLNDLADELGDDAKDLNEDKGLHFDIPKSKKFKGHYAGFEFGLNNFLNSNYNMTLSESSKFMELRTDKSWNYSLNFLQYSIPFFSKHVGFVTGMGFEWDNFSLKQNIKLVENNTTGAIESEPGDNYKKNTLNMVYFKIPLIFEFQIPTSRKGNPIFCGIGAEGSVKVASKTRKVYEILGDSKKIKEKGDYQLSPLRYGVTARVGYEALQLFANYSLQSLFETNQGPELYPFSVGLRIDF